jgi:two-component system OmpR family response regulator
MRRALERIHADAVILDVSPGKEDGFAICRELRQRSQIPLFIVSSRAEEVDRIVGLELGADAYLGKPIDLRELSLRIHAVLRRCAHILRDPTDGAICAFTFDGWNLDTTTRTLTNPMGSEQALTGAEYWLLAALLGAFNQVISRERLLEMSRAREYCPFDRSIDVRISRLRHILQEDARAPRIIKTVYRQGYVVAVPVESQCKHTPHLLPRHSDSAQPTERASLTVQAKSSASFPARCSELSRDVTN